MLSQFCIAFLLISYGVIALCGVYTDKIETQNSAEDPANGEW